MHTLSSDGGGEALRVTADEIPRRLSRGNMAANSWSAPFFILSVTAASHTSPTTNPLLLHLSLFVHPWIISLFSLPHCLLSICRLFRRSLSLWFSPWSCEAHWASARYEKNNAKNNLNKSLLSEFSWNKIQLIIWSCFISSCRKNMLAFYISANQRHVCLHHWYSFLISYKTCQITLTLNVRELTSMSWWRGCGGVTLSNSTPASVNSPDIFNQTSSSCLYRQNQVSPNMPKPIGVCA